MTLSAARYAIEHGEVPGFAGLSAVQRAVFSRQAGVPADLIGKTLPKTTPLPRNPLRGGPHTPVIKVGVAAHPIAQSTSRKIASTVKAA
jgi:hypothetical protein